MKLLRIAVLPACVLAALLLFPRKFGNHHVDGSTAAVQSIRNLQTAQVQFFSQFGRYAASVEELQRAHVLFASPNAGGYRLSMTSAANGYVIHAEPLKFGVTGSRRFFSDQTMVVHQNYGQEPATISSPELK